MTPQQKKIRKMLAEKQGILLVHYYARPEIQEIADVLGDSLALAQAAARSDAKVIVFAGVHFMAQSAAILSPQKTVLLPRVDAGCPLADMATAEAVKKMRQKEPDAVFVTYINSTAEVKAESDICCTSSNAIKIINTLPPSKKVVMLPDGNLARHVASVYGQRHCRLGRLLPGSSGADGGRCHGAQTGISAGACLSRTRSAVRRCLRWPILSAPRRLFSGSPATQKQRKSSSERKKAFWPSCKNTIRKKPLFSPHPLFSAPT